MTWEWFQRQKTTADEEKTSLTFTDVIFGLVITQAFIQTVPLHKLTTAERVHIALAFVIILGSYIGYRRSKKRADLTLTFFNLPLLRFVLDLAMVFSYYLFVVTPNTSSKSAVVSPRFDATVVLTIFALYAAWDLVSLAMDRSGYPVTFRTDRFLVTVATLVASAGVVAVAWLCSDTEKLAIVVDSLLIGITLLYRWAKDSAPQVLPAAK